MNADTRPPFNFLLYGISQVIVVIATIPRFLPKTIKFLSLLFAGYVSFDIIYTQTTGSKEGNVALGSAIIGQFFIAIDYLLLSPSEDLRDLDDKDTSKITEKSFKKRALWALKLYANPRGIGCSHEPAHLPLRPSPSTPRWKFVASRFSRFIVYLFLCSMTQKALVSNPGLTSPGMVISEASFYWRVLGVACFGLAAICSISAVQSALAIICVGSGISSPDRWPLLFGSLLDAWSIQRFWRRVWHQMFRRVS